MEQGKEVSSSTKKYRFESFEGEAKFLCKGRIMLGVHYKQLGTTLALIFSSWGCFFSVCFHLQQFQKYFIFGTLICCLQVFLLLCASLREPGIIPRVSSSSSPSAHLDHLTLENLSNLEYCKICNIFKLPRTKHCRYCDCCVSGFDHHCPWVGSCIGVRNYSFFFLLLTSIVAGSLYIDYTFVNDIILSHVNAHIILKKPMLVIISFVVVLLFSLFVTILVGALLAFHFYLCFTKQTTQEFLKGRKSSNDDIERISLCTDSLDKNIQLPLKTKKVVCGLCCEHIYYKSMLKPMWELDSEHDDESHVIQSKVQGDNHEVVNREMIEKIERELQMPPGNYFSTPSGSNSESDRTTLDDQTNANRTTSSDFKTTDSKEGESMAKLVRKNDESDDLHHHSTDAESLTGGVDAVTLNIAATKYTSLESSHNLKLSILSPHTPPKKSTSLASLIASTRNSSKGNFSYFNVDDASDEVDSMDNAYDVDVEKQEDGRFVIGEI